MTTHPLDREDDLVGTLRGYAQNGAGKVLAPRVPVSIAAGYITQAADLITQLRREWDEARAIVIGCNNSLFGSEGYFVEASGKRPVDAIEDLKQHNCEQYRALQASQADNARLRELIGRAVEGLGQAVDAVQTVDSALVDGSATGLAPAAVERLRRNFVGRRLRALRALLPDLKTEVEPR